MKNKKLVALVLAAVLVLTSVIGGTLAYFTDTEESIKNVVTLGNVDITLTEEYPDEGKALLPNTELTKEAYVENTGDVNAYARVVVAFEHSESTNTKGGLAANLAIKHTEESIYEWYTNPDHIQLADGKWYSVVSFVVNKVMEPGDKAGTLMKVGLDADVTYEDLEAWGLVTEDENGDKIVKDIEIHVAAQAVQVDGIDAEDADTTGEGYGSNIDDILDLAFGDIEDYTADELSELFGLKAE